MAARLERHDALEQLIDAAWELSRRLDLDLVKFLLEMAKLELYQEVTMISSSENRASTKADGAPRRPLQ
jgi:hypothetical protein